MKTVSQLNASGYFTGPVIADESPLEPGVYLIPGGCVDAPAPTIPSGQRARWADGWVFEDIPAPEPEPVPEPPAPVSTEALRRAAYQAEADPLFFKSQRGEATQAEWLAKVAEIKARYP
jgi:hypothetical protein